LERGPPIAVSEVGTTAKPQLVCLGAASAEWIFHQEKSTLKTARAGYSNCGFCSGRIAVIESDSPLDIRPERELASGRMSTREPDNQSGLLQGTLDLLILQTVVRGPVHGHAIAKSIENRSQEVLQVGHGSLYPALQRLIKDGLIAGEDGTSENNRKARFYRLTAKGRRKLFAETSRWKRFSEAIGRVLTPLPEESK
jgi:transcriptional regulator